MTWLLINTLFVEQPQLQLMIKDCESLVYKEENSLLIPYFIKDSLQED